MKATEQQLRKLIREEVETLLSEVTSLSTKDGQTFFFDYGYDGDLLLIKLQEDSRTQANAALTKSEVSKLIKSLQDAVRDL